MPRSGARLIQPSHRSLMAATTFFLILGYEFIRSSSNSLFQQTYGSENLALAMMAIPLAMIPMIWAYNRALSRLGPQKTFLVSSLASSAGIVLCLGLIWSGVDFGRIALFIFRETYIVIVLEQCWSFLDSTETEENAAKSNSYAAGFSTLGAVFGGWAVYWLAHGLGTSAMPAVTAITLVLTAGTSWWAYDRAQGLVRFKEREAHSSAGSLGLAEFRRTPLLISILSVVMLTQLMSTVLGLAFQHHLQQAIPGIDAQTAYSGRFYAIQSMLSLGMQFLIAPMVLRHVPMTALQLAIPVVHVVTASLLFAEPGLATAGIAFMAVKALDYSFFRITKEMFYLPLSSDVRFRTKQLIDVLGYRVSKGAASSFVVALKGAGIALLPVYPLVSIGSGLIWMAMIFPLVRNWSRIAVDGEAPRAPAAPKGLRMRKLRAPAREAAEV